MNKELLREKNLIFPSFMGAVAKHYGLNLDEFLVLIYFWNFKDSSFDVNEISKVTKLDENEILLAFNSLMSKKIILFDSKKDSNGRMKETVNLEFLYGIIEEMFKVKEKEQEKVDIYSTFETEFGRPISSMEYEIIRAWLEKGFTEELILGALKEAVYNGVNNLRYIDKILYEWQRKGYKNMSEVSSHNTRRTETDSPKLFDYNWLDDNE